MKPEPIMLSEEGSFAKFTFFNRFPKIIQQVINDNNLPTKLVQELETLRHELNQGTIRELNDNAWDVSTWNNYLKPYFGKRWIELPFFFAEVYFYRRILQAIRYFDAPPEKRIDPFAVPKRESLKKVLKLEQQPLCDLELPVKEKLLQSIYNSLWGNQEDLSQLQNSQQEQGQRIRLEEQRSNLIVDHASLVTNQLINNTQQRIDIIADNAGSELLRDLYLIDIILSQKIAEVIHVHLKRHPTFVSDATVRDFLMTLQYLENHSYEAFQFLAKRVRQYLNSHQLRLREDPFWTMPLFCWEMDTHLKNDLSKADLVIIKGDANYRRFVGDLHWEPSESFENIVSYFSSPLMVLRVLKSELIVGITPEIINHLQRQDSEWLINGRWGIIQAKGIS